MAKIASQLLACLLLATFVYSEPNINSTTGTVEHGSILIIQGDSFGFKENPAPLTWDNCESGSVEGKWDVHRPSTSSGNLGSFGKIGDYRDKTTIDGWGSPYGGGVNPPHLRSTKYYCSNAYTTGSGGGTQQDESSLGMITGNVEHVYISFYYQIDPNWTFGIMDPNDGNHKMMSLSSGNNSYSSPYAYWGFRCNRLTQSGNPGLTDNGIASCDIDSCNQVTPMTTNPIGNWVKLEYLISFLPGGFQKALADNGVVFDRTSCTVINFNPNYIGIGGYHRDYGPDTRGAANWRYFDDIYFDTSLQRVMLANNSNYDNATIIEPQIPSAWNSNGNSITCTVNLGKLPDSGTAYLFVFDADNKHNPVGYTVALGGGGGGGEGGSFPGVGSSLEIVKDE